MKWGDQNLFKGLSNTHWMESSRNQKGKRNYESFLPLKIAKKEENWSHIQKCLNAAQHFKVKAAFLKQTLFLLHYRNLCRFKEV